MTHLLTDILNDHGILQINRVQCYYKSKLYYNSVFGFKDSTNIYFTEEYEQISSNGKFKFGINEEKGCLEIHKRKKEDSWEKIWESDKFNIDIQEYKQKLQQLDEKLKLFQIQNNANKIQYTKYNIDILYQNMETQGILSQNQAKKLIKIEYLKDQYYVKDSNEQNKIIFQTYNFQLELDHLNIYVKDRFGDCIWKHKLSQQHYDSYDMIQIQNSGNLAVMNDDYEVRWQTFTGGLWQRLSYYLEQFTDQVLDPILFLGDTYSDIFLLIGFYSQGYYYYFTALLTCMGLERLIQFLFLSTFILSQYHEFKITGISCCPSNLDKSLYAFLTFLYLDPILDRYFKQYRYRRMKQQLRQIFQCFIEALPSIFLNIHSIFYQLYEGEKINIIQYIALFFSVINASKSLFEIKVFIIHEESWQKMLGPKMYEKGNGSSRASVQCFMMIFIFLLTYSYSFGVFTDITRHYGILVFLLIIFGILVLVCLVLWSMVFNKVVIKKLNERKWYEIICYFIMFFIFGLPISASLLTVIISLGAYIDWALDFQNDFIKKTAAYGLQWFLSYLRLGIGILFFVIYYKEDNYEYTTFGFLIYVHLIYNVVYHIILMVQIKKRFGFGKVCKEFINAVKKFPNYE